MNNRVRQFAKEARERLLKNNYDKPQKKIPSGRVYKIGTDPNEEMFYQKVREIACDQGVVTDPLARLMDQSLYNSMNDTEKNRYIFKLSSRYVKMLEKYRNENHVTLPYASIIKD